MPIAPHLLQNDRLPHGLLVQLQAVYDTLKSAEKKAADVLLEDIDFASRVLVVDVEDHQNALVYRNGNFKTVLAGGLIQQLINSRDLPMAAALSVLLLSVTGAVIAVYRKLGGSENTSLF